MAWKNWPYWLKGALTGLYIGILFSIVSGSLVAKDVAQWTYFHYIIYKLTFPFFMPDERMR